MIRRKKVRNSECILLELLVRDSFTCRKKHKAADPVNYGIII